MVLFNIIVYIEVKWGESCSVVSDSLRPMDYIVQGILQARILEWVAFPFSRGPFQPRDRTQVSHIAGKFFTSWATREAQLYTLRLSKKETQHIMQTQSITLWILFHQE